MKCRLCGGETKVLETRTWVNSEIVRRMRKCQKCGHKMATYEMPLEVKR